MANGVTIEDYLPGDVTFISASINGTESSNVVSWDLGSIPSGASGAVFLSVKVNSPLSDGTILHNPASISSSETQVVSTIADVTVLSHPLLELNKTAALPHVSPGDELTYTIEYKNSGTDQATGVTLEDHIPGGVAFVSATGGGTLSNGIVSWAIGIMPAGAPAGSVTIKVKINDPLPNGTVIHNPASMNSTETGSITSQADVSVISAPVLELTKTASKTPVLAGDTLIYTLDYKNVGTDEATGVRLEDQLPGDVSFVSASGGGTLSGSVVSW
ncbi:IPTL-CTERM sorting domain-containing protein, partial [Methylococcaceae bacterium CS1]